MGRNIYTSGIVQKDRSSDINKLYHHKTEEKRFEKLKLWDPNHPNISSEKTWYFRDCCSGGQSDGESKRKCRKIVETKKLEGLY